MAKSYRPVLRDQPMLLPVDMREWLPQHARSSGMVDPAFTLAARSRNRMAEITRASVDASAAAGTTTGTKYCPIDHHER
jgi:hypothetical protein